MVATYTRKGAHSCKPNEINKRKSTGVKTEQAPGHLSPFWNYRKDLAYIGSHCQDNIYSDIHFSFSTIQMFHSDNRRDTEVTIWLPLYLWMDTYPGRFLQTCHGERTLLQRSIQISSNLVMLLKASAFDPSQSWSWSKAKVHFPNTSKESSWKETWMNMLGL